MAILGSIVRWLLHSRAPIDHRPRSCCRIHTQSELIGILAPPIRICLLSVLRRLAIASRRPRMPLRVSTAFTLHVVALQGEIEAGETFKGVVLVFSTGLARRLILFLHFSMHFLRIIDLWRQVF